MNIPARSCRPSFSPQRSWQQVPVAATQAFLRRAFARWGRPAQLRVDNGTPWGATGGLPTALVMWVTGLDVRVHHNPSRRPQANGVVERSQGTGKRWAEPGQCASAAALQREFDRADQRQREQYPYREGRSRAAVFPALAHSGREYSRRWERQHWSLAAVDALLSTVVVERRIDGTGSVSLYSRNHYVGRSWKGQTVYVRYDPPKRSWLFHTAEGLLLQHGPAPEISRGRIVDLTASDGRSKRR